MAKKQRKGKDMVQATAKRRVQERSRTGYVMVELDAADRKTIEQIRDRLEGEHGGRVGLAGALRWLIRRHRAQGG